MLDVVVENKYDDDIDDDIDNDIDDDIDDIIILLLYFLLVVTVQFRLQHNLDNDVILNVKCLIMHLSYAMVVNDSFRDWPSTFLNSENATSYVQYFR